VGDVGQRAQRIVQVRAPSDSAQLAQDHLPEPGQRRPGQSPGVEGSQGALDVGPAASTCAVRVYS
jgi:hypothetical protein